MGPNETTQLARMLQTIIASGDLHCRWLNTLSLMENVGARKIVQSSGYFSTNESVLRHAAEETRHAYYLKRQINKINLGRCATYDFRYLLNGRRSYQYIHRLDSQISRSLKSKKKLSGANLKRHEYVLVTYAIEVRADQLYGIYQECLKAAGSPVSVRGIVAEEEQHLAEMDAEINTLFAGGHDWRRISVDIEHGLFPHWFDGFTKSIVDEYQVAC